VPAPATTVWLPGEPDNEKSGAGGLTVRLAVVVWVSPLAVPVTVIVNVDFVVTLLVPLIVRVVELPALMEVAPKVHVSPAGQVEPTLRLTVPLNPFNAFAVMV
jgi:hypothetical protein